MHYLHYLHLCNFALVETNQIQIAKKYCKFGQFDNQTLFELLIEYKTEITFEHYLNLKYKGGNISCLDTDRSELGHLKYNFKLKMG